MLEHSHPANTRSASRFCMILNTCRELMFCSTTPHSKIPCALAASLSLVGFPSAKSPRGENLPPPQNISRGEGTLVSLLLGMSGVELMDCSPKEQLLPIPARGADRPSRSLLHIWLAAPASGTESAWIFAVCRVV